MVFGKGGGGERFDQAVLLVLQLERDPQAEETVQPLEGRKGKETFSLLWSECLPPPPTSMLKS